MINRRLSGILVGLVIGAVRWAPVVAAQDAAEVQVASDKAAADSTVEAIAEAPSFRFAELADVAPGELDAAIDRLVASMTLAEKIGQMCQMVPEGASPEPIVLTPELRERIRAGEVGSIINAPDREFIEEVQRIAREDGPRGVPLLIGRDVVHGYRTVFPIPLGQAASWNPELVERAAAVAAAESRSQGVDWTFAPMVDVCRDPRWGRIAETLGEDPALASALAAAMVRGFQQERDGRLQGVIACVKHFAAYGLSEGGRDYNRVSLSNVDLHNVYLPPFRAAMDAGCRTLMTTFSEVNGVPGTAHAHLLRDVLKGAWSFDGFVVSDWNSVIEMVEHGFSADAAAAAQHAASAGVDMEMVSSTFHDHLAKHVEQGSVPEATIDEAVRRILRVKLALAPQESAAPSANVSANVLMRPRSLELARRLARESLVLLKNEGETLPLKQDSLGRIAVIGPLADAAQGQLGCWALDGDPEDAVTPLEAIREALGESTEVLYARGATADFSTDASGIAEAARVAADADVALVFVGEDALLSGEAHSRAELGLPGAQAALVHAVAATGKPTVLVVMAGRPLTIGAECAAADAVLYAWHPGTMGGPAIADVLLGTAAPSGKLPVTIPKSVGQVPLYYGHSNTGRPSPHGFRPLAGSQQADLPEEFKFRSHYLDSDPLPLYPFGYGLTYTNFSYDDVELSVAALRPVQTLGVRTRVTNTGKRSGTEVVQLYVRDVASSIVRPVKELKAFRRVHLRPGESKAVEFAIDASQLAYLDADGRPVLEPGQFLLGVGGDSNVELTESFEVVGDGQSREPSPAVARATSNDEPRTNGKRGAAPPDGGGN